jgi:SAM-dependent methyltransferase
MSEKDGGWSDDWASYYDLMDVDRGPHVGFYAGLATPEMTSLLDLGCGTGSITLEVVATMAPGARVVGVDLSARMIEMARARAPHYDWRLGDLSRPPVEGKFDLIMVCFHTMQMLLDPADFAQTLKSAVDRLTPKGRFAFDIYQPNAAWLAAVDPAEALVRQFKDGFGRGLDVMETGARYDPQTRVLSGDWTLRETASQRPVPLPPMQLSMRQYAPDEVQAMIAGAGLRIAELWGDLDRQPFTATSKRQIYVCALA